ncbi:transcription initiation factor IIA subunit 1-like [Anthonomus grandis grandis]|uniref:transcription initiation factor IIA subunit 1-like n=1 Tax=Anthonomus grandis grandis TaxID=2921223 RepID=UPI0021657359|nr:transcription initiation factor IIA subunit 1-like [Anthonomus grandis grandis]
MSNSLCKSSVFKTYQEVINDAIENVREHFLEDGIDEAVLQELKALWETKLAATKAVEEVKETDKIIAVSKSQKLQQQHQQQNYVNQLAQQQLNKQLVGQVPPNNHIPQGIALTEWRRVPVQLTIPSPPGCGTGEQRILGIEVPEVFLQGHHLKSILTGPIISQTLNLPLNAATTFLQDQVNNAFVKHQQSTNIINVNMGMNQSIVQTDGYVTSEEENCASNKFGYTKRLKNKSIFQSKRKTRRKLDSKVFKKQQELKIYQGDGTNSSSDEIDLDDEDDDEENENDDDEDLNYDIENDSQGAHEDEPLNSEDDISDADGTEESFETDNVIVCQFDKITRARNRWKFHLKDGIMNLNGSDYVFQKANGDAEW